MYATECWNQVLFMVKKIRKYGDLDGKPLCHNRGQGHRVRCIPRMGSCCSSGLRQFPKTSENDICSWMSHCRCLLGTCIYCL